MAEITIEINNPVFGLDDLKNEKLEAQAAAQAAKTSALSKLAKLGLTDAEIKALTGN